MSEKNWSFGNWFFCLSQKEGHSKVGWIISQMFHQSDSSVQTLFNLKHKNLQLVMTSKSMQALWAGHSPWLTGRTGGWASRGWAPEAAWGHTGGETSFYLFVCAAGEGACESLATHRDARVLVEQHLQQVRRQEGRMFELLLSSDHVGVLLVRTRWGAGHVWREFTKTTITTTIKKNKSSNYMKIIVI